ncbi:SAP domain-containing protein [Aquimarina sp. D1M17]|uniref:DUF6434 domain-containing protein n=1 Tax=Aquimarina acroporae TaxID=2937283 RepID=UPI0020BDDEA5|nr:DUF6434 domain-containing protein [Aquimarina acroporae]MCK8522219.1 SAP domain-containing protein [Aquimarina acroporae]
MKRPNFEDIKSGDEFNNWYWLKEEMVNICKLSGLPSSGRKFDLRDRIMFALDNDGKLKPEKKKYKPTSKFNWAKSELYLETKITDNVSFGSNFRSFMKKQIGNKFVCHSDFMDWVKSNPGKTLSMAVEKWYQLENRKVDLNFKRKIADNNMLAQYIRDFLADNKNKTMKDAKECWNLKKQMPTKKGFVKYESTDLSLGK